MQVSTLIASSLITRRSGWTSDRGQPHRGRLIANRRRYVIVSSTVDTCDNTGVAQVHEVAAARMRRVIRDVLRAGVEGGLEAAIATTAEHSSAGKWDILLTALIETSVTALRAEHPDNRPIRVRSFDDDGNTEEDATDSADVGVRVLARAVAAQQSGDRQRVVELTRQALDCYDESDRAAVVVKVYEFALFVAARAVRDGRGLPRFATLDTSPARPAPSAAGLADRRMFSWNFGGAEWTATVPRSRSW
ncbi:hypothetical protein KUTG_10167 [Kutzneria sp. 744]|nr:hypothetical protein KUTG_10167 [Kutzneria sp. 744]